MADSVFKLAVQAELEGISDIQRQIKKLGKNSSIGIGLASNIEKEFSKVFGNALKASFSPSKLGNIEQEFMKIQRSIAQAQASALKSAEKLKEKGLSARMKKEHQAQLQADKARISSLEKEFRDRFSKENEMAMRRLRALDEQRNRLKKHLGEAAEDFGKGIENVLDMIKGASFPGLANLIKQAGASAERRGQKRQDLGGGTMGGFLKGLGKFTVVLGGIAAGIAALVGAFMGLDSIAGDFNRSLMEAGVSLGGMADNAYMLDEQLRSMRDAFKDGDFARSFGVTSDELTRMMGAFEQGGYTINEMNRGLETRNQKMDKYQQIATQALVVSKNLGLSLDETATNMASYMESLGTSLSGVRDQFMQVFEAAKTSGFGTKRFFNMVLQATSGMTMYNVRLEEASSLLLQLGNILGQQRGAQFVQNLAGGFSGESYQERTRRIMTTGRGVTQRTLKTTAKNTAAAFLQSMKSLGLTPEGIGMELATRGLKVDLTDPEGLANSIGKMGTKQQEDLLAAIKIASGGNQDLARQAYKLAQVSRGARTGTLGDMTKAMAQLDMGGKMAMQLNQARSVIKKSFHEMSLKELMGVEQFRGLGGEQIEELRAISMALESQHKELSGFSKEVQKGTRRVTQDTMRDQVKAFGHFVDENGKIVKGAIDSQGQIKALGEIGGGLDSFIQSNSEKLDEVANKVDPQIEMAKAIARNTMDTRKILEISVAGILNKIYNVVSDAVALLTGEDPQAKAKAIRQIREQTSATRERIGGRAQNITRLRQKVKETDGDERIKFQGLLEQTEALQMKEQLRLKVLEKAEEIAHSTEKVDGLLERVMGTAKRGDASAFMDLVNVTPEMRQSFMGSVEQVYGPEKAAAIHKSQKAGVDDAVSMRMKQFRGQMRMAGPLFQDKADKIAKGMEVLFRLSEQSKAESYSGARLLGFEGKDLKEEIQNNEKAIRDTSKDTQKVLKDDLPQGITEAMQRDRIGRLLGQAGIPSDAANVNALMKGKPSATLTQQLLENVHDPALFFAAGLHQLGTQATSRKVMNNLKPDAPPQKDFLLHMNGSTGQLSPILEHSSADSLSIMGAKPGGPASRMKGGVLIENHFYQDAKANYATLKRVLKEVLGSQGMIG